MAISSSLVSFGTFVGIFALLAIGMNIKFGYTGLLEIGHVAFYLLGGYVTALLVLPPAAQSPGQMYILGWNLPWIPAILIATVFTGLVGAFVSLPAIRLREDYLAITLLGIAFVIQQIFRSPNFRWLANGPRALTISELPYGDLFPLPGASVPSALLSGIVILALFGGATYLVTTVRDLEGPAGARRLAVHAVLAATTLGVGYAVARYAVRSGRPERSRRWLAGGAGAVVGAAAAGATVAGVPIVPRIALGAASAFAWAFGALAVARYYDDLSRREHAVGLGLTLVFLGTLLPLVILGSGKDEVLSAVGMLLTVVLLGALIYGLYYLSGRWGVYGGDAGLVRVIGVATVWLFAIRYFVLSLIGPLTGRGSRGVEYAVDQVIQNFLWLLKFTDQGLIFDYSRFLLVAVVATLVGVYVLAEVTVNAPFGRVLKAIREDEDVATALGKNTFAYKVQSMAVGSAIAGLAGGLTAIQFQSLTWSLFRVEITFFVLLMVIIGGTANNRGVILGSAVFWAFDRATSDLAAFFPTAAGSSIRALRLVIVGALLIVILYYRPEGIWGERATSMEVGTE